MSKRVPRRPPKPTDGREYNWMSRGVPVYYHSVIGEPPTLETRIREEPWLLSGHSWVCMVEGVTGCVACEAVSRREEGPP